MLPVAGLGRSRGSGHPAALDPSRARRAIGGRRRGRAGPEAATPDQRDRGGHQGGLYERVQSDADCHDEGELAQRVDRHQRQQPELQARTSPATEMLSDADGIAADALDDPDPLGRTPDASDEVDVVVGAQGQQQDRGGEGDVVDELPLPERVLEDPRSRCRASPRP